MSLLTDDTTPSRQREKYYVQGVRYSVQKSSSQQDRVLPNLSIGLKPNCVNLIIAFQFWLKLT